MKDKAKTQSRVLKAIQTLKTLRKGITLGKTLSIKKMIEKGRK